jgi:hypothetical protein
MANYTAKAEVAKLADAPDLGSGLARGMGSSPFLGKYLKGKGLHKYEFGEELSIAESVTAKSH